MLFHHVGLQILHSGHAEILVAASDEDYLPVQEVGMTDEIEGLPLVAAWKLYCYNVALVGLVDTVGNEQSLLMREWGLELSILERLCAVADDVSLYASCIRPHRS